MDDPSTDENLVVNKTKGWILKRAFQENKAHQIFQKPNTSFFRIRTEYKEIRSFFAKFDVL